MRPARRGTSDTTRTRRAAARPVFIQNQATANLYYYTPYQPNAAALRAGYGEGDGCSAYGNRNFYQYFTDWFGATQFGATGQIGDYWKSMGGGGGRLGDPIGPQLSSSVNGGGTYQNFQNAVVIVSGGVTSHHFYNSLIYNHYVTFGDAHRHARMAPPGRGLQSSRGSVFHHLLERRCRVDGDDGCPLPDGRQIRCVPRGRWPDVPVGRGGVGAIGGAHARHVGAVRRKTKGPGASRPRALDSSSRWSVSRPFRDPRATSPGPWGLSGPTTSAGDGRERHDPLSVGQTAGPVKRRDAPAADRG